MRIFLTTSWLSLFFIFCHTLEAQQVRGYCGTQSSPVADAQLDANIAYLAAHPDVLNTRGITYVPVRFTIVRPTVEMVVSTRNQFSECSVS